MLFSKFIDCCALYDLHKKRSKDSHFSPFPYTIPDLSERENFYKTHRPDILLDMRTSEKDYSIGTFSFSTLIPSGDHFNDRLIGEVFLNENATNAPNVIFVHGWRMESNDRLKKIFHQRMMDLGWNMYYFTLPYHFQRKPEESLYSGEYMISADIERTIHSTKQAVVDLRALIQWVKNRSSSPVTLIGVSLGGFITNLTATLETEIDIMASIFYANRLSYSIWNTNPGKFIKADLESHGVNYGDLKSYWQITEPSQAIPKMKKDNILLISGRYDQYVHIEDTNYLWESWGRPERHVYNCGHAGIVLRRKKIAEDTLAFIQNKIKR